MKTFLTISCYLLFCCFCLTTNKARAQSFELKAVLAEAAAEYQLDPQLLIAIAQDAQFNSQWVGADQRYGLMQLSIEQVQQDGFINPAQVFEPAASARFAARYLSLLLQRYQGDTQRALAHYHSGKGVMQAPRQLWFGQHTAWASRINKMLAQSRVSMTPQPPCQVNAYLDDFTDPNSRLNRLKGLKSECRKGQPCRLHTPCD